MSNKNTFFSFVLINLNVSECRIHNIRDFRPFTRDSTVYCASRCADEWLTINIIILFSWASTLCPQRLKYCRSFDHRTVSLTWWPIKSNVQQPLLSFTVTFDINHSHQGSAVRFQSAGFLWSLPRTPQQNRPLYITASLGGLLLDTRASLPEWKKNIFKL